MAIQIPSKCRECGSASLSWDMRVVGASGIQDGRHRLNEISAVYWIGCDHCSETLLQVNEDQMMGMLNKALRMPSIDLTKEPRHD